MSEVLNRITEPMPLLSICIPSYNRCEKVYKLVNDILLYPGQEIEVVVLDNCSTDETKKKLSTIQDSRFIFIENDNNIGGMLNPLKALSSGSGKFSTLCLDKDYLDYREIKKLLQAISLDPEVVFGHCEINMEKEGQSVIYDKGYPSVANMAYLSRHPSGMFYKTTEYVNLDILKRIFFEKKSFPFNLDLVNAGMAMIGKSQKINLPAFFTESKDEASKSPSFTYDMNNVYFSPAKRIVEFDTYIESAEMLALSANEIFKLNFKLYGRELWLATFAYKNLISDPDVCAHNKVAMQKIGFIEIWRLNLKFSAHFFKRKGLINKLQKTLIIFCWDVMFLAKSLISI